MKNYLLITGLVTVLTFQASLEAKTEQATNNDAGKTELKSDSDKASYAIGAQIAQTVKFQTAGSDFSLKAFFQGFKDAFTNGAKLL